VDRFGIRINHAGDYPEKLRHAKHPIELLYYRGVWELTETRAVAVVGARKPTPDGLARTKKLAGPLAKRRFTVVSGLATGVDTAAHQAAIAEGGPTIAVIGTPLSDFYPDQLGEEQDRTDAIPVQAGIGVPWLRPHASSHDPSRAAPDKTAGNRDDLGGRGAQPQLG
jgi:DNA processing protein